MGYKKDDKCLKNAFDDEKLFVLMARDITSPAVVLEWIKENLYIQPDEKLMEAFQCALDMKNTNHEIIIRKMDAKKSDYKGIIFGDHVQMDDRFESVHIWSKELQEKNAGGWTPKKIDKAVYDEEMKQDWNKKDSKSIVGNLK